MAENCNTIRHRKRREPGGALAVHDYVFAVTTPGMWIDSPGRCPAVTQRVREVSHHQPHFFQRA
jgi:hypothetical protein